MAMGHVFFPISYHKITLFEKKYNIKLMASISMYHLKPLLSLDRFIKIKMQMRKLIFVLKLFRFFDNY